MIGVFASVSCGAPAASKPVNTFGAASPGSQRDTGASSSTRPASTSCSTAAVVSALVKEAIQNTVSGVIGAGLSSPRTPAAASTTVPSASRAAAAIPGSPPVTASASATSIRPLRIHVSWLPSAPRTLNR